MNPNASTAENSTAAEQTRPRVRDAHFVLGVDSEGIWHHRDLLTGTVHWIDAETGERVARKVVPDGRADDYVDAVEAERGWDQLRYGIPLVEQLAELVEEQERARKEVRA
jgi:hypothetical protein